MLEGGKKRPSNMVRGENLGGYRGEGGGYKGRGIRGGKRKGKIGQEPSKKKRTRKKVTLSLTLSRVKKRKKPTKAKFRNLIHRAIT